MEWRGFFPSRDRSVWQIIIFVFKENNYKIRLLICDTQVCVTGCFCAQSLNSFQKGICIFLTYEGKIRTVYLLCVSTALTLNGIPLLPKKIEDLISQNFVLFLLVQFFIDFISKVHGFAKKPKQKNRPTKNPICLQILRF